MDESIDVGDRVAFVRDDYAFYGNVVRLGIGNNDDICFVEFDEVQIHKVHLQKIN